jgi:hypothetical protein
MEGEETTEETLLVIPECFVYKIPPRPSAEGYRAKDWNIQTFIWSGRLIITARGDSCVITLVDSQTGATFATCPVNPDGPQAVEPVLDSSRYFVLRIEDGKGHHAFIGMGFAERSQSFDFNVALQDHAKEVRRRREAKNRAPEPALDFSLKEGQTIRVNIKSTTPSTKRTTTSDSGLLPPPPGMRRK